MGWIARAPRKRRHFQIVPFQNNLSLRIFIEESEIKKHDCSLHTIVRVQLLPAKGGQYKAKVLEVLPSLDDPKVELELVSENMGFPTEFKDETLADAKKQASRQSKDRKDLSKELTVTIDGEDARDYDDAIHLAKLKSGNFLLKVSIADVSFFVRQERALDKEAYERGTSIYMPGTVIPMLPEKLSNDVCSLVPKQPRATLTAEMLFDKTGARLKTGIYASKIFSDARLTYDAVDDCLSKKGKASKIEPKVRDMLFWARELSELLSRRREALGYLNIDLPEPQITTDRKSGDVISIGYAKRLKSHRMIENFMVAANEAVAEAIEAKSYPSIYRVHGGPEEEKLKAVKTLFKAHGIRLKTKWDSPHQFLQEALAKAANHKSKKLLSLQILRSMQQAQYQAENQGHFGLGSKSYTHFTSPIRRYPDLIVHRILRESNFLKNKKAPYSQKELDEIALSCSEKEQRAVLAERQMKDIKKCRFMTQFVGKSFKASIINVKEFGFFCEIDDYPVDGLVHIKQLPGRHWHLDSTETILKSDRKSKEFRLGDRVMVQLSDVDRFRRRIDFRYIRHLDSK